MNWYKFEQTLKIKKILFFTPLDVKRIFGIGSTAVSFLLYRYSRRGLILHLKRGCYALSSDLPNDFSLANKLYEPSYISLEFALSFHGIIPETVYEITSITPKSTRRFSMMGKNFSYHRIKKEAFGGYIPLKQNDAVFLIAEPEKAFVDFVYLKMLQGQRSIDRFRKNKLNKKKVFAYARLFKNKRLIVFIKNIFS